MINSHKELVSKVENFASKMELINNFHYVKDILKLNIDISDLEPRVLALGLDSVNYNDEEYNQTLVYRYVISDSVVYEKDDVINSQTETIFIVSALKDYLNHLFEASVDMQDMELSTESDSESSYVTASGTFQFIMKRSPSYWKKMEEYNVD